MYKYCSKCIFFTLMVERGFIKICSLKVEVNFCLNVLCTSYLLCKVTLTS